MLVWCVKYKQCYGKVLWPSFRESWQEFRTNELAILIYPKFVSKKYYDKLKEFAGF